ncbi:MAG: acyltransferase [Steroidobacteraceae bacterium]
MANGSAVTSPQSNNFDLIRLAAALQVAYIHGTGAFGAASGIRYLTSLVSLFPGVPVFFFISGFLISKSFETNPDWRDYARNRCLRIYPALVVCFIVSLGAIWLGGFFTGRDIPPAKFIVWTIAQLTFGQFYNASFMAHAPIWSLNPSLWTITVELQFYVLVPVIYSVLGLARAPRWRSNCMLGAAIALGLLLSEVWTAKNLGIGGGHRWPRISYQLFVPWLYMFLVGIIAQRNCDVLRYWFAGRFIYIVATYGVLATLTSRFLNWGLGDFIQPLLFLGLVLVTFSAAFTVPTLSERLLRKNDVSYGLYIYHRPVMNILLLTGLLAGFAAMSFSLILSIALAYASWSLIEKPALALKRRPLYPHRAVAFKESGGEPVRPVSS